MTPFPRLSCHQESQRHFPWMNWMKTRTWPLTSAFGWGPSSSGEYKVVCASAAIAPPAPGPFQRRRRSITVPITLLMFEGQSSNMEPGTTRKPTGNQSIGRIPARTHSLVRSKAFSLEAAYGLLVRSTNSVPGSPHLWHLPMQWRRLPDLGDPI